MSSSRDQAAASMPPMSEELKPVLSRKYEILRSLSDIRSVRDLNQDAVRDILRRHTRDGGLDIISMGQLEDMSGCNDAFNSSIVSLSVTARMGAALSGQAVPDAQETFHFVIKSPPRSQFVRLMHKFTRPFANEVTWYLDLVKQMNLANGPDCMKSVLPVCYHAYSSYYANERLEEPFCEKTCLWCCFVPCKPCDEGVLILENVKHRGKGGKVFKMYDKKLPLTEPYVRLIMTELAHFHGRWLRFKFMSLSRQLKKLTDEDPDPMNWATFERRFSTQKRLPKTVYTQLKNVAKKTILRVLDKYAESGEADPQVVADYSRRCRQFFNQTARRRLNEYLERKPTDIYTLCHGDFWSNNILFAYQGDQLLDELIIIDYQLLNYGHPSYDLVYFLYLNTDLDFRDKHLEAMLRLYYDTLSTYFSPESTYLPKDFSYTFDQFKIDYDWHTCVGFVTACSVMPNVLSESQVNIEGNAFTAFAELQRKQEEELDDDTSPQSREIRRRLYDLVVEMARQNVI